MSIDMLLVAAAPVDPAFASSSSSAASPRVPSSPAAKIGCVASAPRRGAAPERCPAPPLPCKKSARTPERPQAVAPEPRRRRRVRRRSTLAHRDGACLENCIAEADWAFVKNARRAVADSDATSDGPDPDTSASEESCASSAASSCADAEWDASQQFIFALSTQRHEKEPTTLQQCAGAALPDGKYHMGDDVLYRAELSASATRLGEDVFSRIGAGLMVPERPNGSGQRGFYVRGEGVVGFRGVGGLDLSQVWHMLLVPTLASLHVLDPTTQSARPVPVRWVFDLQPQHAPLLRAMRRQGLAFVRRNEAYFKEVWGAARLAGESIEFWLRPENVQFGFHVHPSVGYLHCHMLLGPVTEFGCLPQYARNWVGLDRVQRVLEQGLSGATLIDDDC